MELFGFGPHLMIDGHHASPERLEDLELLRDVLSELPARLGMSTILPPHVERYQGTGDQDGGLTGVVLIAESHIAIHTFPQRGFLGVDVFSCKEFDVQAALNYLIEHFEVGRYDTHLINRGKEFPKDLQAATRIVSGEREYLEARIA